MRSYEVQIALAGNKLFMLKGLDAYEVGEVGRHIWNLCDESNSVEQVAEAVAQEFSVEGRVGMDDVVSFPCALEDEGLIDGRQGVV